MDITSLENAVNNIYSTKAYEVARLEKFPFFIDYLYKDADLVIHCYWLVDVNRLHDKQYIKWLKEQDTKPWPSNTKEILLTEIIEHFGGPYLLPECRVLIEWIPEFYSFHISVVDIAAAIQPTAESISSLFNKIAKKLLGE